MVLKYGSVALELKVELKSIDFPVELNLSAPGDLVLIIPTVEVE